MTPEERWDAFVTEVWLRGGRALLLAAAVGLLAWTQQHFEYSIWKLAAAAFVTALPHRTFPIISVILIFLIAITLLPPSASAALVDFALRMRG